MQNTDNERINILEDILLKLHEGIAPEDIQDEFNQHFTGVSAIEISMMEHQLIYGDSVITFEDVLKLCNVHANLFKGIVEEGEVAEVDLPGHPVTVFKEENMALRSALMRINNLLEALGEMDEVDLSEGILRGLKRQYDLLSQFDNHYKRKEHLFFPQMEKHGHDAPPKVMWAKDDEIRDIFKRAYKTMTRLPDINIDKVKKSFDKFNFEFTEMIFKEETILINILLEALSTTDWYQIAQQSNIYGYAIIKPRENWTPDIIEVIQTDHPVAECTPTITSPAVTADANTTIDIETKKIKLGNGYLTLSWETEMNPVEATTQSFLNPSVPIQLGNGHLTLEQVKLIFDYLPAQISYVDKDDKLQYFNQSRHLNWQNRQPEHIGQSANISFGNQVWAILETIIVQFKSSDLSSESFWFKEKDTYLHIEYQALYDASGHYQGFIEIVQDIQAYLEIDRAKDRNITATNQVNTSLKHQADLTAINQVNQQQAIGSQIDFTDGQLSLDWLPNIINRLDQAEEFDQHQAINIGMGFLNLAEIDLILNALPFEITYVDQNHKFRYFNQVVPYEEMLFKRSPIEIGRDLEYCHPPRVWPKVKRLAEDLKNQVRYVEPMWFSPPNKLVYILYIGTQDHTDNYRGIVETVLDVKPYIDGAKVEKRLLN